MRGLIIACSLLFCLNSMVLAESDIPVKIKAEKLKYYEGTGLIEASGSVEVTLKDVIIRSDRLWMDSYTNMATAEGDVWLKTPEYSAAAAALRYDASREVSVFSGFASQLAPSKLRGKLYLSAEKISDLQDKMAGENGGMTTCGEPAPHFLIKAQRVEYRPNEKLEGWNVTMYEGAIPVMWLPYLVYDMHKQRKKNWTFGHNEVEGDFIKTAWDYPGGVLLLDSMQKKGYGTGISTGLDWPLGLGGLYLYFLDEKDTGIHDRIEKITSTKKIDPNTTFNLSHSYISTYGIPSGRIDQTNLGLGLSYAEKSNWSLRFNNLDDRMSQYQKYALQYSRNVGRTSIGYSYNYDYSRSVPQWLQKSQRLSLRFPLSDRINFSSNTSYYHRVNQPGDPGDERINPDVEISGSESNFSWVLRENWFIDLRKDLSPGEPRFEFLEKQPELVISPRAVNLPLFTLQPTFSYGYYREVKYVPQLGRKRDYATQRYTTGLQASKSIPLGLGTVMNLKAGLDQRFYGPGDQLYAYTENGSLSTNLGGFFRNDLSYRKGSTDGNSPFFFDKLNSTYHDSNERMTFYYLNKFSWWLATGFNWQTNKWYDLMTHMQLTPDEKVRWNVDTGWDIENIRYKDLVTSLQLKPYDYLGMDFRLSHDLNLGELKYASANYGIYFLKGEANQIFLQFNQVYDPASKELKVRDIMIVKELHCWNMKYSYNDYRKEFAVTFSLNAMPDEPFGFATGRGFYYEGLGRLESEIQKLNPETEIRRY